MASPIRLAVVTPERAVLEEEVEAVVLPGVRGAIGILPHHAPMVVALRPGVLRYRQAGRTFRVAVTGGFFEFGGGRATVLADAAELGHEIDVERARRALERARQRLQKPSPDLDVERARVAMERAVARIKAAADEGGAGSPTHEGTR